MSVCVFVTASPARLSNSDSPRNVTSAQSHGDARSVLGWTAACGGILSVYTGGSCAGRRAHPLLPPAPPPPRSLGGLRVGYQEVGTLMLLRSPLLLDENANLGTVMRYEEIGEWGRESWDIGSHLPPPPGQSGGRERLENPGSSLLLSVLPAEFQARTKVSGVPPAHLPTALAPVPRSWPGHLGTFPSGQSPHPKDMEVEPQCQADGPFFCPQCRTGGSSPLGDKEQRGTQKPPPRPP